MCYETRQRPLELFEQRGLADEMVRLGRFDAFTETSVLLEIILRYLAKSPDTWFARHEELANWAPARAAHKLTYP